jgi:hypothetical protein
MDIVKKTSQIIRKVDAKISGILSGRDNWWD